MITVQACRETLRRYRPTRRRIITLQAAIDRAMMAAGPRGYLSDVSASPTPGGGRYHATAADIVIDIDRLQRELWHAETLIAAIDDAMIMLEADAPTAHQVIEGTYIDGRSVVAIAAEMHISERSAYRHQSAGIAMLALLLSPGHADA